MRLVGTVCSLVMLCLSALGAGPRALPGAARGAAELALCAVAEAPLLVARGVVTPSPMRRIVAERDSPPGIVHAVLVATPRRQTSAVVRVTIANQAGAHAGRPRWRAYDAAAPPAISRARA